MNVYSPIVVKHIKTYRDHNVQMRWLKDKKVLVLVLEHKLVNKGILLKALKFFGQLILVKVAATICQKFKGRVSLGLVVSEQEVSECKAWVSKLFLWN